MDRLYYTLIDSCTESVRLSTALSRNADYKEVVKEVSDPLIQTCIRHANALNQMLNEIIRRQRDANDGVKTVCATPQ